ncbi:MAG: tRNA uridine-5-carboxymethylaminomethyl(34) synthesis enzyme MnmG [Bacteroidetes bacterium]|jgi:tRNA uridine 5-carboxymethylaminomethyl modification enzyme|nr:tRNA uridine-5-carboxymethylaminomethyl(34) synthesis enzyme MnmG [Bacteroidota bacterium]MBT7040523.1 tRNA uridine-5-carboxymethylaminomethyl(34) synthesis enzyme MnmG [Bacteroidota bacterium]
MLDNYDIIVVGGGHAGAEAAAAAANLGAKTLLITLNMQNIAQMSCNPAMGGVAKGQVVREIDALGGYSGVVADKSAIQFRMLNRSKGPAMWSPRTQNDRTLFTIEWRKILESLPNLDFWQDMVVDVIVKGDRVIGVKTQMGLEIFSKAVVLSNGTFLNGKIHIGSNQQSGGRIGEFASIGLSEKIHDFGFEMGRMKTGTPVRVDGRSIDFSKLEEQGGDENPGKFSYSNSTSPLTKQRSCFIAYTNEESHDALRSGFGESPMFTDRIKGVGPRYCPSIEDKINRFTDRNRHQLFVEPEGWDTIEYYINGFSSSLPDHIQLKALRLVEGFENAKIFRPGYAIEYDYFAPTQLKNTLESKIIENLYFTGQINGTTGYEEAAAQGLMAGINAALKIKDEGPFVLGRSEAYIGVLIDDLVTKGTEEPYRLFTSRAEFRILLRQDNADIRLTKRSNQIGLASNDSLERVLKKEKSVDSIKAFFTEQGASLEELNSAIINRNGSPLKQRAKLLSVLLRPEIDIQAMKESIPKLDEFLEVYDNEEIAQSEIQMKYKTYIEKEREFVEKVARLENINIPERVDYEGIASLSNEAREKLKKIRPGSIGQATRISGVSPADVSILLVHLGR